jgi:hypothetical protein
MPKAVATTPARLQAILSPNARLQRNIATIPTSTIVALALEYL